MFLQLPVWSSLYWVIGLFILKAISRIEFFKPPVKRSFQYPGQLGYLEHAVFLRVIPALRPAPLSFIHPGPAADAAPYARRLQPGPNSFCDHFTLQLGQLPGSRPAANLFGDNLVATGRNRKLLRELVNYSLLRRVVLYG